MNGDGDSAQRVGDQERQAAITALGEHWRAGRLDPAEHERRTTAAYTAVTRGDLEALFADLPGGLPAGLPSPVSRAVASAPPPEHSEEAGAAGLVPAGSWVAGHRDALMGLTPFVALILFFTTKWWVWFLLIPAMGTILYAGGDQDRRRRRGRGDG
ncbi:MAG: DUF1707 domain-containing protein [Lapillicoccus sp.]